MISNKFLHKILLVAWGIVITSATMHATLVTIVNHTGIKAYIWGAQLPSEQACIDSIENGAQKSYDSSDKKIIFGSAPNKYINYLCINGDTAYENLFYYLPDQNATTITLTTT